jgi:class 3 adenylate cyclase
MAETRDARPPGAPGDAAVPPVSGGVPRGERRHATVLFADLSGYTAMTERLDPEEVATLMNRVIDAATRIVEAHGGIVNQVVGDEVKALFGVPVAHEDDPARAVSAALALHEFVRGIGEDVERRAGAPLRFHTAINTGLVVTQVRDHREVRPHGRRHQHRGALVQWPRSCSGPRRCHSSSPTSSPSRSAASRFEGKPAR